MDSQKRENVLNLALNATPEERARSLELNTAYDENNDRWEVIVRHDEAIMQYENADMQIVELLGGYAIITGTREQIERLSAIPEVAYIEMPKRLYTSIARGRAVSCISSLQTSGALDGEPLLGNGVLIAILDSGIDYTHPDFRNEDGTTRILRMWDQSAIPTEASPSPARYKKGAEYTKEQIDAALRAEGEERMRIVPELVFCKSSSFFSILSAFLSRLSSFCCVRRSMRWISLRRSFSSRSESVLILWISSLASTRASFFLLSAFLMASLTIRLASSSAEPSSASATFFLY